LARCTAHFADCDDPPTAHGNVTVKARQPGTVNHLAILDNQIVYHRSSSTRIALLPTVAESARELKKNLFDDSLPVNINCQVGNFPMAIFSGVDPPLFGVTLNLQGAFASAI
jgi:hypothetical protein